MRAEQGVNACTQSRGFMHARRAGGMFWREDMILRLDALCVPRLQVVSTLEPRAEPAHVTWKGAALLAALDSGRENWLPRHQWVDGGMVLPAPAAAKKPSAAAAAGSGPGGKKAAAAATAAAASGGGVAGSGGAAAGAGSNAAGAASRHTKLFYYCRAEQGLL